MSVNNNRIYNVMNAGKDFIVNHKNLLIGAAAVGLISVIGLVLFFGKRFSWIQKPEETSERINNFIRGLDAELGKLKDPRCEYHLICTVLPDGTPTLQLERNPNAKSDEDEESHSQGIRDTGASTPQRKAKDCIICNSAERVPLERDVNNDIESVLKENNLKIISKKNEKTNNMWIGITPKEHQLHQYENLATLQKNMLIAAFRIAEHVNQRLKGTFFNAKEGLVIKSDRNNFKGGFEHTFVTFAKDVGNRYERIELPLNEWNECFTTIELPPMRLR